uniref:Uncharacterized protein n=1 Tax=Anguilla anguilla TaxID=7936 RepID=A0A0E9WBH6_ANGAN
MTSIYKNKICYLQLITLQTMLSHIAARNPTKQAEFFS